MGLSTAIGIVKSYRGFINLTSEVGRGSTFEFYLPADFSASSNLEKLPKKEMPRGNGEMVLVIDDEAAIRQVIRQTLETFGYRVVTADGGSKGSLDLRSATSRDRGRYHRYDDADHGRSRHY